MTKRVLNKEKKRTDILDAAYELFTTLGFARTFLGESSAEKRRRYEIIRRLITKSAANTSDDK